MRSSRRSSFLRLVLHLLGHARLQDRLAELGDLGLALLAFPKLAADGRQLLAQQHLAVALVERRLGLPADLVRQAQHLDALGEQVGHLVHAGGYVDGLQDLLLLLHLEIHVGGGEVGELRRRGDGLDAGEQIGRHLRQQFQGLHRLALQVEEAGLDLGAVRLGLRNAHDARHQERPAVEELDHVEALLALAGEMVRAVLRGDVAHQIGDAADPVHVGRAWLLDLLAALHEDAELALLPQRLLRGSHRAGASDRDRQHQAGEQHGAAHGHDDERIGGRRCIAHRPAGARSSQCFCLKPRTVSTFSSLTSRQPLAVARTGCR